MYDLDVNLCSLLPVPNIERLYFHFAEPVDTAVFKAISKDQQVRMSHVMSLFNFEVSFPLGIC